MGVATDRWFRLTVTNHGPDAIDVSPPRELYLHVAHSFSSMLDNGPGDELPVGRARLAAAPPKRIRARATLRLYDAFGDVYAYSTTFKMRRRGRR